MKKKCLSKKRLSLPLLLWALNYNSYELLKRVVCCSDCQYVKAGSEMIVVVVNVIYILYAKSL